MTDKVQKIREEIEKKLEVMQYQVHRKDAYKELKGVLAYIDSLQEEPVSEDLEEAAEEWDESLYRSDAFKAGAKWQKQKDSIPVNEDLNEAAIAYNKKVNFVVGGNVPNEHFIAGAQWQKTKDESTTEDLGEYINELSKQFPEVSFAKLSRIAVRVAKWKKENLWKDAQGDDLPEIDREVIVLVKYSTQRNIHDEEYSTYRVEFGHRPNPNGWDGKSIATGKVEHYTPKTYDKGGWNIPDIVYWLDVELPKEIEL